MSAESVPGSKKSVSVKRRVGFNRPSFSARIVLSGIKCDAVWDSLPQCGQECRKTQKTVETDWNGTAGIQRKPEAPVGGGACAGMSEQRDESTGMV